MSNRRARARIATAAIPTAAITATLLAPASGSAAAPAAPAPPAPPVAPAPPIRGARAAVQPGPGETTRPGAGPASARTVLPGRPAVGTPRPERAAYDRFIVHYAAAGASTRAGRTAAQARVRRAARAVGVRARAARPLATGSMLVRSSSKLGPAQARRFMRALSADRRVGYVEPDVLMTRTDIPRDPGVALQWHYLGPKQGEPAGVNLAPAWDVARGNRIVVAVLDTGITAHPDLAGNVVRGYDFITDPAIARDGGGRDPHAADPGDYVPADDPLCGQGYRVPSSWHGTHVAGTIAAVRDNGRGGVGVAPYALLQPVRVLGRCGGYLSDVTDAVVWAAGGFVPGIPPNPTPARVINLSLGGPGRCSPTLQNAIDRVTQYRGATVVVSAGNSATDARRYQPSSCQRVVTVAALDRAGNRAYYSNYGPAVDVAAPGGETVIEPRDGVYSTLNNGATTPGRPSYAFYQGTSMSAPHVSGVAALLYGMRPATMNAVKAEYILKRTARPVPGRCLAYCGTGLVDAAAAVAATRSYR